MGEKLSRSSTNPPARKRSEERAQLHLRLQYTVAQILADARNEHVESIAKVEVQVFRDQPLGCGPSKSQAKACTLNTRCSTLHLNQS